ncbi:emp24 domain-containing protein eca [Seminavis robusta]|uniref:Emp24 domain-containing protein eca n=1 Tax=Seminavis robusta TaxID=568900 RepID=A0A9N8DSK4_9STRA|nr:emp24 domain-containing protein eca [Seminavis robusta]|eukprot:Sro341_g121370.1 emp24 domain-containing protein eca (266) ;mRNA; f:13237-14282
MAAGPSKRHSTPKGSARLDPKAAMSSRQRVLTTPYTMIQRLLILASLLASTAAYPMFILGMIKTRCLSVTAPQDTVLKVVYEAPDLVEDTTDPGYGPVYISVSVTPSKRVLDTGNHPSMIQQRLKPTSELLKDRKGELMHKVEVDGEAKICVRASGASVKNNMRFGIQIDIEDSQKYKDSSVDEASLEGNLSHMEMEMKRIQNGMKTLLSEADFSKSREAVFHQNTESMHAASTFWPIVQTCVLIMTGFTQARHIVQFFQSRRII